MAVRRQNRSHKIIHILKIPICHQLCIPNILKFEYYLVSVFYYYDFYFQVYFFLLFYSSIKSKRYLFLTISVFIAHIFFMIVTTAFLFLFNDSPNMSEKIVISIRSTVLLTCPWVYQYKITSLWGGPCLGYSRVTRTWRVNLLIDCWDT